MEDPTIPPTRPSEKVRGSLNMAFLEPLPFHLQLMKCHPSWGQPKERKQDVLVLGLVL